MKANAKKPFVCLKGASHRGSHSITTNEVKFVIIFYSNKGGKNKKNTDSPQRQNMQTVHASLFSFFYKVLKETITTTLSHRLWTIIIYH